MSNSKFKSGKSFSSLIIDGMILCLLAIIFIYKANVSKADDDVTPSEQPVSASVSDTVNATTISNEESRDGTSGSIHLIIKKDAPEVVAWELVQASLSRDEKMALEQVTRINGTERLDPNGLNFDATLDQLPSIYRERIKTRYQALKTQISSYEHMATQKRNDDSEKKAASENEFDKMMRVAQVDFTPLNGAQGVENEDIQEGSSNNNGFALRLFGSLHLLFDSMTIRSSDSYRDYVNPETTVDGRGAAFTTVQIHTEF